MTCNMYHGTLSCSSSPCGNSVLLRLRDNHNEFLTSLWSHKVQCDFHSTLCLFFFMPFSLLPCIPALFNLPQVNIAKHHLTAITSAHNSKLPRQHFVNYDVRLAAARTNLWDASYALQQLQQGSTGSNAAGRVGSLTNGIAAASVAGRKDTDVAVS